MMFTFVIGHSKAGKSKYAERLAVHQSRGPRIYIATLIPVGDGEEGAALVRRHRAQRDGLEFTTFEQPLAVSSVELPQQSTVLLEDASNLLANSLFCEGASGDKKTALADILALRDKCDNLVVVSFYGLEELPEYDEETNNYIRQLAVLNEELKQAADAVVMLTKGVPAAEKGELVLPQGY